MSALPIAELLPEITRRVRERGAVVVHAPPGAGKTTLVPLALLREDGRRSIWVLQPRRLAARLAARWVASSLGEAVGERVGYRVRFDERVGPDTRLCFVTEAMLLRRLLADPDIADVDTVVFDELHERHLAADVGLALVERLRATRRPDLRVVAMSATLEADRVAGYLDCGVVASRGRQYPVEIEHLRLPSKQPLERDVAQQISRLTDERAGHVLVFLPGAAEIRRAAAACEPIAKRRGWHLLALHGDLPLDEQARAIAPSEARKIILATNVAETSITIDGVDVVIDSGLARVPSHDPWTSLSRLATRPVSRASAEQRAGRAGRTGPGFCMRLFTKHDFTTRRAHEAPEILRSDLAEPLLWLKALGIQSVDEVGWLDEPPNEAIASAAALLADLGAIEDNHITPLGKLMSTLPLHPRQSRIVLEAAKRGFLREGCAAAAVIAECGAALERSMPDRISDSDVVELVDLMETRSRRPPEAALQKVVRAREQLIGSVRYALRLDREGSSRSNSPNNDSDADAGLRVSILAGYPDRVAKRREPKRNSDELLLARGGSARLARSSSVRQAEWLVAARAEVRERRSGSPLVRLASAIDPSWLLDLYPHKIVEEDTLQWNERLERVERVERLSYEGLLLDETVSTRFLTDQASELLCRAALRAGASSFAPPGALDDLVARVDFLSRTVPELDMPVLSSERIQHVLRELCEGRSSFAELRQAGLLQQLEAELGAAATDLERLAPRRVMLGGGRRLRVHYECDKPPWVESFLQDFFGARRGPVVADGRAPLTLHLLAPNRRAVQVTSDLSGFWENHYPKLRRALSRRYPRHAWPEDPLAARPPQPRGRRR